MRCAHSHRASGITAGVGHGRGKSTRLLTMPEARSLFRGLQSDATELLNALVALQDRVKRDDHSCVLYSTLQFRAQYETQCGECSYTTYTTEPMITLPIQLPVQAAPSFLAARVDRLIRAECAAEMLTDSNRWQCHRCQAISEQTTRTLRMKESPQFLVALEKVLPAHGTAQQKSQESGVLANIEHL